MNRLPEIPNRCITSQTTSWVVLVKLFCRNVTVALLYWLNPSSPSSLPRLLISVHAGRLTTLRNLNPPFVFEPIDCVIEDPLCDFTLVTSDEVSSLVMKGSSTFSPDIDVIPTTLLKANIGTLAPVLTRIVNLSIESSTVPKVMKHAVVTPLLKKTGLDPESLSNYRPISNLSFISKLLERIIASQIRQYMVTNDIFDVFQSAYRPAHSCETALVRIQNDILVSLDNRKSVILVLLDLSAAFDTVDHPLLLDNR